jgi:hypothetical protein
MACLFESRHWEERLLVLNSNGLSDKVVHCNLMLLARSFVIGLTNVNVVSLSSGRFTVTSSVPCGISPFPLFVVWNRVFVSCQSVYIRPLTFK